ncbi:SMC-Scp complex subunit ScpB [Bacterioplanoides sp.]|uniref:SMC-Scp complex subunit ScpB n=1 Tax=Bacterioplanoides sp. TaxID=2066072 RepID=UPI003B5AF838
MSRPALKNILEAVLMAAGGPVSLERMQSLFDDHEQPKSTELKQALTEIKQDLLGRGIELIEVATGYRLQVRTEVAPWVGRLWDERPQRYSRALLETLALIAYRQPITRGDIEDVRGVVVSSQMMKTLIERDWVRIVGYRDVPGRPAMYATTKEFLDYFGLKTLEDLPSLMEIRELEDTNRKLELGEDAEARKETPKEYDFTSEEDVEERGASVLDATEEDLAKAAALVDRVEANVFARPDDEDDEEGGQNKPRDLGDLLKRLETVEKDRDLSDLVDEQQALSEGQAPEVLAEVDAGTEMDVADREGGSVTLVDEEQPPELQVADFTDQAVDHNGASQETADVPKTLEDAQRARLLAEQQAIKDRLMAEIAAEQAAQAQEELSADQAFAPEMFDPEMVETQVFEPEEPVIVESHSDVVAEEDEILAAEARAEKELLEAEEQERLLQQKLEQERLEAEQQAEQELLEAEQLERQEQQMAEQLNREQEQLEAEARAEAELLREMSEPSQEEPSPAEQNEDDEGDQSPSGPSLFG